MTKKDRQLVFDKYNGRCAYCGCELQKGWHADHTNRVHRYNDINTGERKMHYPENDNINNMLPACPSCNIYKGGCDLDTYRWKMNNAVTSLNKHNAQYRFAKRYGLIKETGIEVKFYFETLSSK